MLGKNLKYWRLRRGLAKKDLASLIGVTSMAITHYENDERTPDLQTVRKLTSALNVKLGDLLASRDGAHKYVHAEFRRNARFGVNAQEYVRESDEEYFDRFFSVVDSLGIFSLPEAPECHSLMATGDPDADALALRAHLGFSISGPIKDLIGSMENKGILIYLADIDNDQFSGMNGSVDDRPFVILNSNMSGERQRSTLIHELAHLFFKFERMSDKEVEKYATAISGAFLFPKEDAIRELGVKRTRVTQDMVMVAIEYGISMLLLTKRAQVLKIISDSLYKDFMIKASQHDWRKNEPTRIERENTVLFEQLVIRAIGEEEITMSKGAELLRITYAEMMQMMHPEQEV